MKIPATINSILPLFLICLIALTGCTTHSEPMGKPLPRLNYTHLSSYTLKGGAVALRQSFNPDKDTIRLNKEFPIPPNALIQQYAQSRFVTFGVPETFVFDIESARLSKRKDEDNLVGFLSGAAVDFYLLEVYITLSQIMPVGLTSGVTPEPYTISIKRELLLPDQLTLAEREFRQFEFLEQVITDIDKTINQFVAQIGTE